MGQIRAVNPKLEPNNDSVLVNFSCELGLIMTRYDFLYARRVTQFHLWSSCPVNWGNNGQIGLPMGWTSDIHQCLSRLQLDLITPLVNFSCELGANNDQIGLFIVQTSDFDWYSKWLQHDFIICLLNLSYELRKIMTKYNFLEARRTILSNVWTDSNFI